MEYTQKPVMQPAPMPIVEATQVNISSTPAPIHYAPISAPVQTSMPVPCAKPCGGGFSSTGVILVLFILLVIISRSRV